MKRLYEPSWRTQSKWKRRFYARYMGWLERIGYGVVLLIVTGFIAAFNYPVDDMITADKIKIEPTATTVLAEDHTLVLGAHVEELDEVNEGDSLLEVVVGEENVRSYRNWQAAETLRVSARDLASLSGRFPKPKTTLIRAPAAGAVRLTPSGEVSKGEELARILDYRNLQMKVSLSGQTVARARLGQKAKVTSIAIEPEAGTLFRGSTFAGAAVSGRVLGDRLKAVLESGLAGRGVRVRDDIPLVVDSVSEVQVEASLQAEPGGSRNPILLDPSSKYEVQAQLVEGAHAGTIQVADLPSDLASQAERIAREQLEGKVLRTPDGTLLQVRNAANVSLVAKVKVRPGGHGHAAIAGTALAR
ncbi:MAG TPA: hypothetical protein VM328_11110, partial [Fimbriimonadaceae bacterium]|nr:hypothetical protein [Fimbriimonadaceae bacterium]